MTEAPDIVEIRAAIVARLQELAPLVAECARLEEAEAALEEADRTLNGGRRGVPGTPPAGEDVAPYGYKANGEPYQRPPRSPEASARAVATRRANAAA